MVADGDRLAVGLSGGKDSMALMWMLTERLNRIPVKYKLFPIYIDPGFEPGFSRDLAGYCEKQGYNLHIEYTDYGIVSNGPENRENPCFLCSRLRRKRLFEITHELGCKKLALGHHKDDLIETLFLNIFYSGEISTMVPVQSFFNGEIKIIRPLALSDEESIGKLAAEQDLPIFSNSCPESGISKRKEIKGLLQQLYRSNKKIKGNIFRAMNHVNLEYLL
ncbi:MAG: tRNA 2-thiocytidine(32) synthetase TtcA [Desulfobacterales bacterium]|nr:tRNA 2-thiocytidine(32) synthetase TtcA [Desulfobacterales bacterium]